jgi:hypothetical protein
MRNEDSEDSLPRRLAARAMFGIVNASRNAG